MKCPRCGTESAPGQKFCRSCGAAVDSGASVGAPNAGGAAPPPRVGIAPGAQPPYGQPPVPPPGMVPMMYQAYPGGPQQMYYVPAHGTHAHVNLNFLEGIEAQIRNIAGSDKLEGFSLGGTFSETFKHHAPGVAEEYAMCGSSRTTPPIEMVDTNWPKPWIFFRLLAFLAIAAMALYFLFNYTQNQNTLPAFIFMGAFAMPLAVLVFIFEMNTPRNVSVVVVGQLFLVGGMIGLCMAVLEYQVQAIANFPGPIEESSKLLAVVLVMYGARGVRYRYELNGILFGCAVGAGFACFETCGYALFNPSGGFIPLIQNGTINLVLGVVKGTIPQAQIQAQLQQVTATALASMVSMLELRGALAPFGHVVWTPIAAGAFWRVKQDKPVSLAMLGDQRFLLAFLIPVLMHSLWDLDVTFPKLFNPQTQAQANTDMWIMYGIQGFTAVISWYVLFTMIQQGLNQVRNVQKAQLQATLAHVQTTLQPVPAMGTYALQPQGPAGA